MATAAPDEIRKSGYSESRTVRARDVHRAARLFKVLSHPDRLRLACRIGSDEGVTQKDLVEEFGWPQSTTARHLGALRQAGLVVADWEDGELRLRLGNPVGLHLMKTVCDWVHEPATAPRSTDERPLSFRLPASASPAGSQETT